MSTLEGGVIVSLRHAILGLLADGPASGYDLMRIFDLSLAHVWHATQSQVYTELGRMADAALVSVEEEGPRGRKSYGITAQGRRELHDWLLAAGPAGVRRDAGMLKVFFLGTLPPAERRAVVEGQVQGAQALVDALAEVALTDAAGDDDLSAHGRLVLDYGMRAARTRRDWALDVLRSMDASATPVPAGTEDRDGPGARPPTRPGASD